jgi:hypothetical protein
MSDIVAAPWTGDQVASLNAYQACRRYHPFTCGVREPDGTPHILVATQVGWNCPRCTATGKTYTQLRCHGFMADWSWDREPL